MTDIHDTPCTDHTDVDWLFDPSGPNDPAWIARVRAELKHEPVPVGRPPMASGQWAREWSACRNCSLTDRPHAAFGRCTACHLYRVRHGAERPERYWRKESAA